MWGIPTSQHTSKSRSQSRQMRSKISHVEPQEVSWLCLTRLKLSTNYPKVVWLRLSGTIPVTMIRSGSMTRSIMRSTSSIVRGHYNRSSSMNLTRLMRTLSALYRQWLRFGLLESRSSLLEWPSPGSPKNWNIYLRRWSPKEPTSW